MMPASPWIGSKSTATVLSSIAWAIAAASPKGTDRNPGVNGPNPSRAIGSDEKLTALMVRPWKLLSATMILACPAGTPLTSAPHLRATLRPLSTASAPEFIGSTMSLPHNWARSAQNGPRLSEWKARLTSVTVSSWAWAVAVISGLRWPKLTAEYAARQSRYRRPSTSVIHAPSALAATTGSGE